MPLKERILSHIEHDENGCWVWTAKLNVRGYASFKARWPEGSRRRFMEVHRISYELFRGPIPEGMTLDHLCRVKHCVNPFHLDPCPLGVNVLRGQSSPAINARKTACKRGHLFTPENTRINSAGYRQCRKCDEIRRLEYQRLKVVA